MFIVNKLKKYFPIKNINDIVKLCQHLLSSKIDNNDNDHNIIFISILLGLIEYKLTQVNENEENIENKDRIQRFQSDDTAGTHYATVHILSISFNDVMSLYKSFVVFVEESIAKEAMFKDRGTNISRRQLRYITDCVFSRLTVAKYKENCHNQSIFSFLTDKSLDSFGLAYTILAVTRQFGYRNVCLALSEDHAWLEYDDVDNNNNNNDPLSQQQSRCTADVAWTGKNEDKRCCSIDLGVMERSRLYLGGNSVVCVDNAMTIAAAITTINPVKGSSSISTNGYSNRNENVASYHSLELALLKRDLLWITYNMDLLHKYPLATINLADLERNYPKYDRHHDVKSNINIDYPLQLYREAVEINIKYYDNCHVYPYLSMANYFYHHCNFIRAIKCWRLAANVISKYNYKSEDWIIYREFFEIATHFIPNIFRTSVNKEEDHLSKSSGSLYLTSETGSIKESRACSVTKGVYRLNVDQRATICEELKGSIDFLTEFLCFFDFICLWEEGSSVPVLHEVWANKFKEVLMRFKESTRVSLNRIGVDADILNNDRSIDQMLSLSSQNIMEKVTNQTKDSPRKFKRKSITSRSKKDSPKKSPLSNEEVKQVKDFWKALANEDVNLLSSILSSKVLNLDFLINVNPIKMYDFRCDIEQIDYENLNCENLCQLKSEQGFIDYFSAIKSVKNILSTNGENVKPVTTPAAAAAAVTTATTTDQVLQELSNDQENRKSLIFENKTTTTTTKISIDENDNYVDDNNNNSNNNNDRENSVVSTISCKVPLIKVFKSQKMKEICPLIVAPGRLNIPAIKLPLTAQSQVSLKRTGLQSVYGSHSHEYTSTFSRKRLKRE